MAPPLSPISGQVDKVPAVIDEEVVDASGLACTDRGRGGGEEEELGVEGGGYLLMRKWF